MYAKVAIFLTFSLISISPRLLLAAGEDDGDAGDNSPESFKQEQVDDVLDNMERGRMPVKYYDPVKLEAEKSFTITIEPQEQDVDVVMCQAVLSIAYLQFDTKARIDTVIENEYCAASSGEYKLTLQVMDENGDMQTIEYVEPWSRVNDAKIETRKFYDVGNNVELLRTTVRSLDCRCVSNEKIIGQD